MFGYPKNGYSKNRRIRKKQMKRLNALLKRIECIPREIER
jgi:hypothetical protein